MIIHLTLSIHWVLLLLELLSLKYALGNPTYTVSEGDFPRFITTIQATDPDGDSDGTLTYDFIHPVNTKWSHC